MFSRDPKPNTVLKAQWPAGRYVLVSELYIAGFVVMCLLIALGIVWSPSPCPCSPKQPDATSGEQYPSPRQSCPADVPAPRIAGDFEVVPDSFLQRVAYPFSETNQHSADAQEKQGFSQLRIVADRCDADNSASAQHCQCSIPLVQTNVFEIHAALPSFEGTSVAPPCVSQGVL